jgi:hypothetical protein
MELDDLKAAWSQQALQIDLVRAEQTAQRIQPAMARLRRSISIELALVAIVVVALGSYTFDHRTHTALGVSGVVLMLYALAYVQGLIRQLIAIGRVRGDDPIVSLQRSLEHVRLVRTTTTLAAILVGPLMWLPMLTVTVSAVFGVDLYTILAPAYLATNVVAGAAVIPLAVMFSRRYGGDSPLGRAVSDTISGRDLRAARAYVASLDRFENPT